MAAYTQDLERSRRRDDMRHVRGPLCQGSNEYGLGVAFGPANMDLKSRIRICPRIWLYSPRLESYSGPRIWISKAEYEYGHEYVYIRQTLGSVPSLADPAGSGAYKPMRGHIRIRLLSSIFVAPNRTPEPYSLDPCTVALCLALCLVH